jgi:hypothetical protein
VVLAGAGLVVLLWIASKGRRKAIQAPFGSCLLEWEEAALRLMGYEGAGGGRWYMRVRIPPRSTSPKCCW